MPDGLANSGTRHRTPSHFLEFVEILLPSAVCFVPLVLSLTGCARYVALTCPPTSLPLIALEPCLDLFPGEATAPHVPPKPKRQKQEFQRFSSLAASPAPLSVAVRFTEEPFTAKTGLSGNDDFSGYLVDLFKVACELGNVSSTLHWFEVLLAVKNGTFDAAVSDFVVTEDRTDLVAFTAPYLTSGYSLAARVPAPSKLDFLTPFTPFSGGVWLLLVLFLLCGGVALFLMEGKRGHSESPERRRSGWSRLGDHIAFAFTTPWSPGFATVFYGSVTSKMFLFCWYACFFVILSSYTGTLVGFLTSQRTNNGAVLGWDDLTGKTIAAWKDDSPDTPYTLLRSQGYLPTGVTTTTRDGIDMLIRGEVDAVVDYTPYMEYWVERKCGVRLVGTEISKQDWAFALSLNSTALHSVNVGILSALESRRAQGLWEKWVQGGVKPACKAAESAATRDEAPTLGASSFAILFLGVLIAAVICLAGLAIQNKLEGRRGLWEARPL